MNAQTDRARWLFACLGDVSRYRIVGALSSGERCVTELAREVALSQSCTTRHLQALQRVGLVSGERQGKRVVFRLRADDARVGGLLEWIRCESLEGGSATRPELSAPRGRQEHPPDAPTTDRGAAPPVIRTPGPPMADGLPNSDSGRDVPLEAAPDRPARRARDLEDYLL